MIAPDALSQAHAQLAAYRRRDRVDPTGRVRHAGWRILLDLLAQEEAGRPVSVSSACLASGAPPTTGLRHIEGLEMLGYVQRDFETPDRRCTYLALTDEGRAYVLAALGLEGEA